VEPPLWSSAAMKPALLEICANIFSFATDVSLLEQLMSDHVFPTRQV
jgi:hypothetical protein